MYWRQWMLDAWVEVKATPVQSVACLQREIVVKMYWLKEQEFDDCRNAAFIGSANSTWQQRQGWFAIEIQRTNFRAFFQDGRQMAQAMTPIFNRVRASPPLPVVWKFGLDPWRHSKDRAPANIKKKKKKKRKKKTDAAQNNTFRKRYFRAVTTEPN